MHESVTRTGRHDSLVDASISTTFTPDGGMSDSSISNEQAVEHYSIALLRALRAAGVKFIRYFATDLCNNVRCKVVPLAHILKSPSSKRLLEDKVSFTTACLAALPSYADSIVPETGLDARGTVTLVPAIETLHVLPYAPESAIVLCNLVDTSNKQKSEYCSRGLLQAVLEQCRSVYNMEFNVGAELEFCLIHQHHGTPVDKSHYAGSVTLNQQQEYITDVYEALVAQDMEVELLHAESAAGQLEFVLQYQDNAVRLIDSIMLARETLRAVAHKYGLEVLFLPKIDAQEAGNGLHLHMSMREAIPTTVDRGLTEMNRRSFIEGILRHLPALLALSAPTEQSFERIRPGCWTGYQSCWDFQDKEAAIRVISKDNLDHFEYKLCDAQANLYLVLCGIVAAGLHGIRLGMDLRPARSNDPEPALLPSSLSESLNLLESDLELASVFPSPMLKAYIAVRRAEIKHCGTSMDH